MRISDWSSDVCSSDLPVRLKLSPGGVGEVVQEDRVLAGMQVVELAGLPHPHAGDAALQPCQGVVQGGVDHVARRVLLVGKEMLELGGDVEIGRASCRERVCQYV